MIRGPDATIVRVPPSIAANPIGMRRRDIGILLLVEILRMAGKNKAAAPMFCMKADINPTAEQTVAVNRFSLEPPTRRIGPVIRRITPERSTP